MATTRTSKTAMLAMPTTMKAAAIDKFGPPSNLKLHTLPVPKPKPGEVLIALHAAGVGWCLGCLGAGWLVATGWTSQISACAGNRRRRSCRRQGCACPAFQSRGSGVRPAVRVLCRVRCGGRRRCCKGTEAPRSATRGGRSCNRIDGFRGNR